MVQDYTNRNKTHAKALGSDEYHKHKNKTENAPNEIYAFAVFASIGIILFAIFNMTFSDKNADDYTGSSNNNSDIVRPSPNIKATPQPAPNYESRDGEMQTFSINDAYRSLNGRNVDLRSSEYIGTEEEDYLRKVFDLVDFGVVERAQILHWHNNGASTDIEYKHGELIEQLDALDVPLKLRKFHDLVTHGMIMQREFFEQWDQQPLKKFNVHDKVVQQSHNNIYSAYLELMRLYGKDGYNKNVFFQHLYTLCLD